MYIRFGELPINEKSSIFFKGKKIGEENGVSVFYATEINGNYHIVLQNPINEQVFNTLHGLFYSAIGCFEFKKTYLVDGNFVGFGADREPLIKNVKIIKEINICANDVMSIK